MADNEEVADSEIESEVEGVEEPEYTVDSDDILPVLDLLGAAQEENAGAFQSTLDQELKRRINNAIDSSKTEIADSFGSEEETPEETAE